MPKEAARLFVEITEIRVECLNQITEADAQKEGANQAIKITPGRIPKGQVGHRTGYGLSYIQGFKELWDSINAKRGFPFNSNPWLWVISFRKLT